MRCIDTILTTTAIYSDKGDKRYLLRKVWDADKPRLAIIMLAPSEASGIELDNTTLLVLNNASRLGYGSVSIVNLFSKLGDFKLKHAEESDEANLITIQDEAKNADLVIYAAGVGKATNKDFIMRQAQVLNALRPYEKKLHCLTNKAQSVKYQHPLAPAVRTWYLLPMKVSDIIPLAKEGIVIQQPFQKRGRPQKPENHSPS